MDSSGWTYGHERGRRYLKRALSGREETSYTDGVTVENAADAIETAVTAGNQVIFTTPKLLDETL